MNVQLRNVQKADLPVFYEHQLDPVATRMVAFTSRDQAQFAAHWKKILADAAVAKKTILFEGHVVGYVLSFERSGKREVGYWIGREHWGKGIATKALRQFLRHDPERPLYGVVAKHNAASLRVLEKCGFAEVGRSRGSSDAGASAIEEIVLKLDGSPGQAATDPQDPTD